MNYTTMPVIFSALDSNGGDTRGLTFAYDFDNDGVYDETSDYASAQHIYDVAGTYTATVLVTDTEFKLESRASAEFVVADVTEIESPSALAEGAEVELNASVDREVVQADDDLTLTITGLIAGEAFGAKLVAVTENDPWSEKAAAVYGPYTDSASLHISEGLALGPYTLLVVTDAGRSAEIDVSIVGPDTAAAANAAGAFILGPLAYIGSGVMVVGVAILIWILERSRRKGSKR